MVPSSNWLGNGILNPRTGVQNSSEPFLKWEKVEVYYEFTPAFFSRRRWLNSIRYFFNRTFLKRDDVGFRTSKEE